MGLCLSLCSKDVFLSGYQGYEHAPLMSEAYLDRERSEAQKKEALEKMIDQTRSRFVDINHFTDIRQSAPSRDVIGVATNENFVFGNGMINHYSGLPTADYEILNVEKTEEFKQELLDVMKMYNDSLDALAARMSLVDSSLKVMGKI